MWLVPTVWQHCGVAQQFNSNAQCCLTFNMMPEFWVLAVCSFPMLSWFWDHCVGRTLPFLTADSQSVSQSVIYFKRQWIQTHWYPIYSVKASFTFEIRPLLFRHLVAMCINVDKIYNHCKHVSATTRGLSMFLSAVLHVFFVFFHARKGRKRIGT